MAVYAVGDIQGCYDELVQLLDLVKFEPAADQLWLVGDLVNRGPKSLETLRFVKQLDNAAVTVLGNHDLHLLALAAGNQKHRDESSLDAVLRAPDRDELLHWLRHRPLLHSDPALGFHMIHAGLSPDWDMTTAKACARELEAALRGDQRLAFLLDMYGNKPDRWDPQLQGQDRLRFITNCFTRMRYLEPDGRLALKDKGPPGSQQGGRLPWFEHPARLTRNERILFGHWSTLGYVASHNVWALDSGCLWGGALTALRIDLPQPRPVHLPCQGQQDPRRYL
jgi:bis(5'-nucleosyl)-tetraphosphatase (symmetrical)